MNVLAPIDVPTWIVIALALLTLFAVSRLLFVWILLKLDAFLYHNPNDDSFP